jgi:hypothetical protein
MANNVLTVLAETGGFTMDLHAAGFAKEGFAVSVNPERTRKISGPVDSITLVTYVSDNWDLLSENGKVFGGWLDRETGITYLDVVTLFDNREDAERLGREHGEIAIFDLETGTEIRL